MLRTFEEKLGLPPLEQGISLLTGPTGKRLTTLLSSLETLSKDKDALTSVVALLEMVERLDKAGTLIRLTELLRELGPLARGKTARLLVEKLDKIERLAMALLGDEK